MKSLFLLAFGLATTSIHALASEGVVSGGGGRGVLCEYPNRTELHVLDLIEAKHKYGLEVTPNDWSFEENVDHYLPRMFLNEAQSYEDANNPEYLKLPKKALRELALDRIEYIPVGARLRLVDDSHEAPFPPPCRPVQVAYYTPEGKILMDREYWRMLTPQHQLALLFHEIYYAIDRENGARNSVESRYVTGMFLRDNFEPQFEPLWYAKKRANCMAGVPSRGEETFEARIAEEARDGAVGLAIYFKQYKNASRFTRTEAFLPGLTLDELMEREDFLFSYQVPVKSPAWDKSHRFEFKREAVGTWKMRAYQVGKLPPPFSTGFCNYH